MPHHGQFPVIALYYGEWFHRQDADVTVASTLLVIHRLEKEYALRSLYEYNIG